MAASAWDEILAPVPLDYLQECYVAAMREHDPREPFKAAAIFKVWNRLVVSGEVERRQQAQLLLAGDVEICPYHCSAEGFYTADQTGQPAEVGTLVTFARPCPKHHGGNR